MEKRLLVALFVTFALVLCTAGADAKTTQNEPRRHMVPPPVDLPADIRNIIGDGMLSAAVADTFVLGSWDFGDAVPDPQGWISVDLTAQLDTFFHIASGSGELTGGTFGKLLPIEGDKSVWCGASPNGDPRFCGYAALPGYGNGWVQYWTFSTAATTASSLTATYLIRWESEPGYDETVVQYLDGSGAWVNITSVNGGVGYYDNSGTRADSFSVTLSGQATVSWRFYFTSDGAFSDEDGLWPTDGAVLVDSITTTYNDGGPVSVFHDFELEPDGALSTTDGLWNADVPAGFGDFAQLYPGTVVLQDNSDCYFNLGWLWGFFDDPAITNYACHFPNPLPEQGAIRFGPDANGQYIQNQIWSPKIPLTGAGDEFLLDFLIYLDLPLDNLLFYQWAVRSWVDDCPTQWRDYDYVWYVGKGWRRWSFNIGALIEEGATDIQLALGVIDMCAIWCSVFGSGDCHSQGPLFDDIAVKRVNVIGPRYAVRHIDLFQDNFAEDGTTTGTARADMADDIASSSSPTILPGDSVCIEASPVGGDPLSGTGPAAYCYVAVWPPNQPGKTPADIEAPETRAGVGKRWPLVNTQSDMNGTIWACFRMDSAITSSGFVLEDRYCVDLNDMVFTPGDTICYFFGASDATGNPQYWTRDWNGQGKDVVTDDFDQAAGSPCEFTILPAGGWARGGNTLYVDIPDDRGGPLELYYWWNFRGLGLDGLVDRYDVLGASSAVNNTPASRVRNVFSQIIVPYRNIIWSTGSLPIGIIGDGVFPKPDDFGMLHTFLDQHPNYPGLYFSGEDIAETWVGKTGTGAINLRSDFMNFNLVNGDHVSQGEPVSPTLVGVGSIFTHLGIPDSVIAYGGCPVINDFDLLGTTASTVAELANPLSGQIYMLSQATANQAKSTAHVVLGTFDANTMHQHRHDIYPVARTEVLWDILLYLQNIVLSPVGIEETPIATNHLDANYPNPFNPVTTIAYSIKEPANVSLRVYNVAGQLVRTLVNEQQTPQVENFRVTWNGRNDLGQDVSSGVYFYKLVTKGFSQTKKMVLLK